jgi:hypothetical protein
MNALRRWMNLCEDSMVLQEARSAPLYHGTPLCNLLHIISQDRMQANRRGFISLSRSYHVANYFRSYSNFPDYGGVLVLDQQKLSQRYRLAPYSDNENIDDEAYDDEGEERVFRDIQPLSPYLLSINIDREAIKMAPQDRDYQENSEDYEQWFGGKRRQFLAAVRLLLKHPAVNRWAPRLTTPNTRYVARVEDTMDDEDDDTQYTNKPTMGW